MRAAIVLIAIAAVACAPRAPVYVAQRAPVSPPLPRAAQPTTAPPVQAEQSTFWRTKDEDNFALDLYTVGRSYMCDLIGRAEFDRLYNAVAYSPSHASVSLVRRAELAGFVVQAVKYNGREKCWLPAAVLADVRARYRTNAPAYARARPAPTQPPAPGAGDTGWLLVAPGATADASPSGTTAKPMPDALDL